MRYHRYEKEEDRRRHSMILNAAARRLLYEISFIPTSFGSGLQVQREPIKSLKKDADDN